MIERFATPPSPLTTWAFRTVATAWVIVLLAYVTAIYAAFTSYSVDYTSVDYTVELLRTMAKVGMVPGVVAVMLAIAGWLRKERDECNFRPIVLLLAVFSVPALVWTSSFFYFMLMMMTLLE